VPKLDISCYHLANLAGALPCCSIGFALTDTLDDLISDHRMDPQLAMKILANFDRAIAETLQDKVKARLTFKVRKDEARIQESARWNENTRLHQGWAGREAYEATAH